MCPFHFCVVTQSVCCSIFQAEYQQILFGGGSADDSVAGPTQTINLDALSDDTRRLVMAHARILAGQDVTMALTTGSLAELGPASPMGVVAGQPTGHTPARTVTDAMLRDMFPGSPASGESVAANKALTPYTAPVLQGLHGSDDDAMQLTGQTPTQPELSAPKLAAPHALARTPTVTMQPRRMSFATADDFTNTKDLSGSMSMSGTHLTALALNGEHMDAMDTEVTEEDKEKEAEAVALPTDTSSAMGAVAEFFHVCQIAFADRPAASRPSTVNGFVERDARMVPPPVGDRSAATLQLAAHDNVALDLLEKQCHAWHAAIDTLRGTTADAVAVFEQQPPQVMQMLPMVPTEQVPLFAQCMQMQRDKCAAEAEHACAARKCNEDAAALETWASLHALAVQDLAAASSAVGVLSTQVADASVAHATHLAAVSAAVGALAADHSGSGPVAQARVALVHAQAEQDATTVAWQALQSQVSETHQALKALAADPAVLANQTAVDQRQAAARAAFGARAATQRKVHTALAAAVPWAGMAVTATTVQVTVAHGLAVVTADWDASTDLLNAVSVTPSPQTWPTTWRHLDRAFVLALLAAATPTDLATKFPARVQLSRLLQAVERPLGRVSDLLTEMAALGHVFHFAIDTRVVVGAEGVATPTLTVSCVVGSNEAPVRLELDFAWTAAAVAAYPTVACPVPQLRQRLNHFRVLAALGEQAQPAGLATLVASTQGGWQRLTGVCRTLRQQAAEGAVMAEQ